MIEYILFACSFFLTLPSALDTNYLTVATDFLAWRRRIRQLHTLKKQLLSLTPPSHSSPSYVVYPRHNHDAMLHSKREVAVVLQRQEVLIIRVLLG